MPSEPTKELVTVTNPHPGRDYRVRCETPEFTCLCPLTGQPDFATVTVSYVPDQLVVELKSLKLYLWSYRNEAGFHEDVTNRILDDLMAAAAPRQMTVTTDWLVTGGHPHGGGGIAPVVGRRAGSRLGRILGEVTTVSSASGPASAPEGAAPPASPPRTFHIRTFGCQMNEHDSERLAGALLADGLVATDRTWTPPMWWCSIPAASGRTPTTSSTATSGNLKTLRQSRPGHADRGGRLPGPDGPGPHPRAGPPCRRGVRNAQPDPSPGPAPAGGRRRTGGRDPRRTAGGIRSERRPAGGRPGRGARSSLCRMGHHPDRVRQLLCLLHRPVGPGGEVSRPSSRPGGRGARPGPAGGHRSDAAGTERQLLRAGHHPAPRRCSPICCRPVGAVEGIRRVRFTSPHPKDLRPETDRGDGRDPGGLQPPSPAAPVWERPVLAAMRRGYTAERYLARLAEAREAIPDLAVTTDLIVGFPGETEDDFERTLEVAAEAGYDSAYTFVFSPRPGTRAASMARPVRRRRGGGRSVRTAPGGGGAIRASPAPRPDGSSRGGGGRGASKRDPTVTTGRTSQNKLVHFRAGERIGRPPPDRSPMSWSPVRPATTCPATCVEVTAGPSHRVRIPVSAG